MAFTVEQIYNVLPELDKIGIKTANPDDGWFEYYGDWNVNRSPGKFPEGEKEIIEFVHNIHKQGFKTNLWWYPLGVSPQGKLAKERPDLLVQAEDGSFPLDSRGVYQLCPAYEPALRYIEDLVARFTGHWGFDGLYSDSRGLAAVPPCFNMAHHHLFLTWKKWIGKYRALGLSRAEYVNLYDIAFDKPEIHVVKKGDEFFYGVYADSGSKNEEIILRGLEKGVSYSVYDYNHDRQLGTINGSNPVLNTDFTEYLLIRLKPENK